MSVEEELTQLQQTIKDNELKSVKPKSAIDELKETLQSLRDINPALVDSSKIFEHLLTLVDAVSIVDATNSKIDSLTSDVNSLKEDNKQLKQSYIDMKVTFRSLASDIKQRDDLDFKLKEKSLQTLNDISQYLRTHQ